MTVKGLEELVWILNEELEKQMRQRGVSADPVPHFEFTSDGHSQGIRFFGVSVWDSETGEEMVCSSEEDRKGKNDFELVENFVRDQANQILEGLSGFRFPDRCK